MSTISHNKYICKGCTKRFIDCKCIDLCDGKFNKTAILMSFLSFGGLSMKKVERERRQYFSDNYDKPKKRKFNVVKKIEKKEENVCCCKCDEVVPIKYLNGKAKDEKWIECSCGAHDGWYCPDCSPGNDCWDDQDCDCCNPGWDLN